MEQTRKDILIYQKKSKWEAFMTQLLQSLRELFYVEPRIFT